MFLPHFLTVITVLYFVATYIFQFKPLIPDNSTASPFWPKANFKQINKFLSIIDLEFQDMNTYDFFNKFVSLITYTRRTYAPQKARRSSCTPYKPWEYKPPKALINRQKNSWNHYKEMRTAHGRHSTLASEALRTFLGLNYQFRNFSNQNKYHTKRISLIIFRLSPKSSTRTYLGKS